VPFTGRANATIDAKSRLAIPAKFRSRWDPSRDGATWFCVPWAPTGSLRLYTSATWHQIYNATQSAPSLTPSPERAELETMLHASTEEVDVDANNRIRLPAWQVEALTLPRDVIVLGAGDRIEIRAREPWESTFQDKLQRMNELAQQLAQSQNTQN